MYYALEHCRREITSLESKPAFKFTGTCVITGTEHSVIVMPEELDAYNRGVKIQNAMSRLSIDDREFLMSGISKEGWDQTFKDDDYIEEDEVAF